MSQAQEPEIAATPVAVTATVAASADEALAGPPLPPAGAWRRFFARLFDMWWQIPLVAFTLTVVLSLLSPAFLAWATSPLGAQLFAFVCIPFAFALDAALLARFGRSPGKALLGLRVTTCDGDRLRFRAALLRNLHMWLAGLALTIPLLNLVTMARQGLRIGEDLPTSYDEGKYRVDARPLGWRRVLGFIGALLLMGVILGLLARPGHDDTPASAPEPSGAATTWINPETGNTVTVPPAWRHHVRPDADGRTLYQFDLFNGRAAVVLSAQPAGVATLADMARDSSAALEDVEMGAGRFEDFLGHPSWAAEGFSSDDDNTRFEVRVLQRAGVYWKVILVQDYPYKDTDARADALRDLLWSTVAQP